MPRVLNTIRTMRQRTDLPVGVTDCQGPLTTALQIIGYDKMCPIASGEPVAPSKLESRPQMLRQPLQQDQTGSRAGCADCVEAAFHLLDSLWMLGNEVVCFTGLFCQVVQLELARPLLVGERFHRLGVGVFEQFPIPHAQGQTAALFDQMIVSFGPFGSYQCGKDVETVRAGLLRQLLFR